MLEAQAFVSIKFVAQCLCVCSVVCNNRSKFQVLRVLKF